MIKAYCDGACRKGNPGICAGAFVVYAKLNFLDEYKKIHEEGFWLGEGTNNYAEYSALRHLLEWLGSWKEVTIYCDSKLVVEQVNGRWNVGKEMAAHYFVCYGLLKRGRHKLIHVNGHSGVEGNELADKLCNEVLDDFERRGFGKANKEGTNRAPKGQD